MSFSFDAADLKTVPEDEGSEIMKGYFELNHVRAQILIDFKGQILTCL